MTVTDTSFIILAVYQNIFKLQLNNKLKVQSLSLNSRVFTRKTIGVDDRRILSIVKKNPFTTSSQVKKNTLQEVGVSLSLSQT